MRTNVADTSRSVFHGLVVPHFKDKQEQKILNYIASNGESTIGEIADALEMEKSTVSARQNGLRQEGKLVFGTPRKCKISGITCKPLKLPVGQMEFPL